METMVIKVLFVCLGNICRSPAAEAVFQHLLNERDLSHRIYVDSAGTSGCHKGDKADSRMREHAEKRGIKLTSISRQLSFPKDFDKFDYIIVMDNVNLEAVRTLDKEGEYSRKILKITDFANNRTEAEVPDPYYGGAKGFEQVLDIVTDGAIGLLEEIEKKL